MVSKGLLSEKPRLPKVGIFLQLDSTVPESHEGDSKEETKSATNLSNQGGGGIEQLLFLNQGVPGCTLCSEISLLVCLTTWTVQAGRRQSGLTETRLESLLLAEACTQGSVGRCTCTCR